MNTSPLSDSEIAKEVGRICQVYELAWRRGESVSIEVFLNDCVPQVKEDLLIALVRLDSKLRSERNEELSVAQYSKQLGVDDGTIRRAMEDDDANVPGTTHSGDLDTATVSTNFGIPASKEKLVAQSKIGRYEIQGELGAGTYGEVYLALDTQLNRQVAIKTALPDRIADTADLAGSLYEARQAVSVESEGIVRVLDIDLEHDPPYIVMEYVDGGNLKERLAEGPFELNDAVTMMMRLAKALGNAHKKRVFHLDIKPANILLDPDGRPLITDFGFAIHQSHRNRYVGTATGTPAYMAPEQVRREANKYDGSTDIWSLGVIFYEMLTGERPFSAPTRSELIQFIIDATPQPMRQLKPGIPKSIERICLKCLAPQQLDRYTSTVDLVDDLQWWLDEQAAIAEADSAAAMSFSKGPIPGLEPTIRPQGLRSFDASHADFYLSLLPGPYSREGVPECVAFWTQRIESRSKDAFQIGVVFGPSGCGKSSLVSAGIEPQLSSDIVSLEVLCTGDRTAADTTEILDQNFPKLAKEKNLVSRLARLRDDRSIRGTKKVLIVLNQFEQFLHTWDEDERSEVLNALRHCDGANVQCLLSVRADFFHSLARFMRLAGVHLREGQNMAGIDLFDKQHATKVLGLFGQALGKVDESPTESQNAFMKQVVDEIERDGKVICVRIAVIAEMMKHRDWTLEDWESVGRAAGVGESFLEETFASSTAPPTHRLHQEAARHVLGALLPSQDVEIKGDGRAYSELLAASRYEDKPEFDELLGILDDEVRLITPIEQGKATSDDDKREPHYQLAHDYLVPSLRRWLTSKQTETPAGRAELLLEQYAGWWKTHQESRFLPSIADWARIRRWTKANQWSETQRSMMKRADGKVAIRSLLTAAVVGAVLLGVGMWSKQMASQTESDRIAAQSELEGLKRAKTTSFPDMLVILRDEKTRLHPPLMDSLPVQENWRSSFVVLAINPDKADREAAAQNILQSILLDELPLEDLIAIRDSIRRTNSQELFVEALWEAMKSEKSGVSTAVILAGLDPGNPGWKSIAKPVSQWLVNRPADEMEIPVEAFKSVGGELITELSYLAKLDNDDEIEAKLNATDALVRFAQAAHVHQMVRLALRSSKDQLETLLPWLEQYPERVADYCSVVLELNGDETAVDFVDSGIGQGSKLRALFDDFQSFHGTLSFDYAWCPPISKPRFESLVEKLRPHGYRPTRVRSVKVGSESRFAAQWLRDGFQFQWDSNLTRNELVSRDRALQGDGYRPIDVSVMPTPDGVQFCCVWGKTTDSVEAKIEFELSQQDVLDRVETNNRLAEEGWLIRSIDVMNDNAEPERFLVLSRKDRNEFSGITEGADFGMLAEADWIPNDFAFRRSENSSNGQVKRYYDGHTGPGLRLTHWWQLDRASNPVAYVQDDSRPTGNYVLQLSSADSRAGSPSDTFAQQHILAKPHTNYLFSGWIKTKDVKVTRTVVMEPISLFSAQVILGSEVPQLVERRTGPMWRWFLTLRIFYLVTTELGSVQDLGTRKVVQPEQPGLMVCG